MAEVLKDLKVSRQLRRIDQAQTAQQVAFVVNTELPSGLDGEAYLRGQSKWAELNEDPRILNQAWRKGGK